YLLRQIIHHLIHQQEVSAKNIFYINFENEKFSFVRNSNDLSDLVEIYLQEIAESQQKIYFFFDEIQEIDAWEKLVNSYKADHTIDCEIFITGSNSKLLSSELATYLTGRFVEIPIYPISYEEYLDIKDIASTQDTLLDYLNHSQLPELIQEEDLELKHSYIRTIKNSILLNDVVRRFRVENIDLLEKLFGFLIDNIANPFSANSIQKAFKQQGYKSNTVTIGNYLRYLEYSFLIYGVDRYDIKGKRILEGEKKFYLNDLGFRNYLSSSFDPGIGKKLENFVFQKLIMKGYQVYVGNLDSNLEVDFVAEKAGQKIYLQVAYLLDSEKVIEREYGNLEKIHDNWDKYVVSLDKVELKPKEGIKHIQAWKLDQLL
ncbi:MAG: ATP-binding protein, partial [Candidatus Melainabacteria bacterium]|nr:ATP-binding protein [Candidatus Melainabacteria bacterium]